MGHSVIGVSLFLIGVALIATPNAGFAAPPPGEMIGASPSDPRAEFHDGNVTTCADISGVPDDDIQIGGQGAANAQDAYVSGTTDGSTTLDVTITPAGTAAGVVVDAVVVKGGDGYNVYLPPSVPPQLPTDQNYISPLNGGGNVPEISHWFVCYHLEGITPKNAILGKVVIQPDGTPVVALPTSYSVTVTCTGVAPFQLTFGPGGGVAIAGDEFLNSVPAGATCVITENDTDQFPAGSTVRYVPEAAGTTGVVISGTSPTAVAIINDFSNIEVKTSNFTIAKSVVAQAGETPPTSYQVLVVCKNGNGDFVGKVNGQPLPQLITIAGNGDTTTVTDVPAGSQCAATENTEGLPGWTVQYSVDGATPTATYPIFTVPADRTVAVTITNTMPATPPTTQPPAQPTIQPATAAGPELASTGIGVKPWVLGAALLLIAGTGAIIFARRLRTTS